MPRKPRPNICSPNQENTYLMATKQQILTAVIDGIQDKKGRNIVVVDLSKIETAPTEAFVICTGGSPQQVESIAGSINDTLRERHREKAYAVAGLGHAEWVAIDYGTVMVHIFLPELRDYYDLEHLWQDAQIESIPDLD